MLRINQKFDIKKMAYSRLQPFNELPDLSPTVNLSDSRIIQNLIQATRHLGELNGLCATLPDPMLTTGPGPSPDVIRLFKEIGQCFCINST